MYSFTDDYKKIVYSLQLLSVFLKKFLFHVWSNQKRGKEE